MLYLDRFDAGNQLAENLQCFISEETIILSLPRGGVPVGYVISKKLYAPLDVLVVRKLGTPGNNEFAFGAIAPGAVILDRKIVEMLHISEEYIDEVVKKEASIMVEKQKLFKKALPAESVTGKSVIIVDDGLATGATATAAILAIKKQHPKKVIFASPVCAKESIRQVEKIADVVICLHCPQDFLSVSYWYRNFPEVSDSQVIELMRKEHKRESATFRFLQ